MSATIPKYSLWEAVGTAIRLGMRALEEIRALSRLPGPRGADGLGFDDLDCSYDGNRKLLISFRRGADVKQFEFDLPIIIYRGVYKTGESYLTGDSVTWGGSLWIALRATGDKPETSDAWQLAAKRGRDGKDGKDGPQGPQGPEGKAGRDLTQLGANGGKW